MYDKFAIDPQASLKPAIELAEINVGIAEKLVQQQAGYVVDMLNASVEHAKLLGGMSDAAAAFEAQQGFARDVGQRFADAAKLQFETLTEAKDATLKLFEGAVQQPLAAKNAPAKKAA